MLILSQSPNLLQFVRSQQSQRQAHLKTVEKGMQSLFSAIESIEHKQPAPSSQQRKILWIWDRELAAGIVTSVAQEIKRATWRAKLGN